MCPLESGKFLEVQKKTIGSCTLMHLGEPDCYDQFGYLLCWYTVQVSVGLHFIDWDIPSDDAKIITICDWACENQTCGQLLIQIFMTHNFL